MSVERVVIPAATTGPDAPAPTTPVQPSTPADSNRPDWLPQEFATPEQMALAYKELTKSADTPAPEAKPEAPADGVKPESNEKPDLTIDPKAEKETPAEDAADAAAVSIVERAGLKMDALQNEVDSSGDLSEESYAALEKQGLPRALVQDYVEGRKARIAGAVGSIMETIGGVENFTQMANWARETLPAEDLVAYNAAVASGDNAQASLAVKGMWARYERENGNNPARSLSGGRGSSVQVYQSWAQVTQAMNDPRYKTDPAFRSEVERRLEASDL